MLLIFPYIKPLCDLQIFPTDLEKLIASYLNKQVAIYQTSFPTKIVSHKELFPDIKLLNFGMLRCLRLCLLNVYIYHTKIKYGKSI